jgi:uncharacterized protein YutE (UPF0331/DUF86 family)
VNTHRRKDSQHLDDAREHLRLLQEHLTRGSLDDVLIRDAVSHRLEVAIDAVGRISKDLLHAEAPDDGPKIVGMRNLLAHQYAELDQEILENTMNNRLAGLVELVDQLHAAAFAREKG